MGARTHADLAFWVGILDADFEVVDSPELAEAVERLAPATRGPRDDAPYVGRGRTPAGSPSTVWRRPFPPVPAWPRWRPP
jgi:hypothetical protein